MCRRPHYPYLGAMVSRGLRLPLAAALVYDGSRPNRASHTILALLARWIETKASSASRVVRSRRSTILNFSSGSR